MSNKHWYNTTTTTNTINNIEINNNNNKYWRNNDDEQIFEQYLIIIRLYHNIYIAKGEKWFLFYILSVFELYFKSQVYIKVIMLSFL